MLLQETATLKQKRRQHILESILGQMEHLKRTYKSFTNEEINLYIDQSDKPEWKLKYLLI